ncbi:MAG: UPF0149 family protein [Alphaproteobacteria bacterium]
MEISASNIDIQALDEFLMSDLSPSNCMMVSDLDGFLTGIAVGPEFVSMSEWFPVIWGGEEPVFKDDAETQLILGSIIGRYNQILHQITEGICEPIFWCAPNGIMIAADWAEGFMQATCLREKLWDKLFKSKEHEGLYIPILALCCNENGESLLGLEPEIEKSIAIDSAELIPECTIKIAEFWGRIPLPEDMPRQAEQHIHKAGRNDPCPCGSGKKFKKCCGRNH